MINGNITRTFYAVVAFGYKFDGLNADGTPNMVKVESDSYTTVNPNNKSEAKKAVKSVDKAVILDTVDTRVVGDVVISMPLDDFYRMGTAVTRAANGRIK